MGRRLKESSLDETGAFVHAEGIAMDWPKEKWDELVGVLLNHPSIIAAIAAFFAIGAWWLKGQVEKGAKAALKGQIDTLNERLKLASERESFISLQTETLKAQVTNLEAQVVRYVVPEVPAISATVASISSTASDISKANTELAKIISVPTLTFRNFTVTSTIQGST